MCVTLVVTRPNCCRWGTYWQISEIRSSANKKNSNYMLQWILYSFSFWNRTYSRCRQPNFLMKNVGQWSICTSMQSIVPSFDVIVLLTLQQKGDKVLLLNQVSTRCTQQIGSAGLWLFALATARKLAGFHLREIDSYRENYFYNNCKNSRALIG